jgi:hypothetical protein
LFFIITFRKLRECEVGRGFLHFFWHFFPFVVVVVLHTGTHTTTTTTGAGGDLMKEEEAVVW